MSPYSSAFSGEWHCSVHHAENVMNRVIQLIDSPASGMNSPFSSKGFAPNKLSYDTGASGVLEKFTESNPVASCKKGTTKTIMFHPPKETSRTMFIVTKTSDVGKEEIYYSDFNILGGTTFRYKVPQDAPSKLTFHFLGKVKEATEQSAMFVTTQYKVEVK